MKPTTIILAGLGLVAPSLVNAGPATGASCVATCVAAAGVCHTTSAVSGFFTGGVGWLGHGICHGATAACTTVCKAAFFSPTP
ncbi:hypothetical protein B0H66DRAFT_567496 [Apodospora peruviana]|uniref:Uncharacterized protein n=1 Tax=Apodospora peruviana TaxID=516989 RepID=A0AAE0M039_9PEZI|nr:hypothetical protein B0H66DRAFT_567496 [Apodospora peruviana]